MLEKIKSCLAREVLNKLLLHKEENIACCVQRKIYE